MGGAVQMHIIFVEIKHPFKPLAHAYGPGYWRTLDFQDVFDLIQQFNGIPTFTVQFIDKTDDRCIPQTTHFHKLYGAFFHPFGTVNNH